LARSFSQHWVAEVQINKCRQGALLQALCA